MSDSFELVSVILTVFFLAMTLGVLGLFFRIIRNKLIAWGIVSEVSNTEMINDAFDDIGGPQNLYSSKDYNNLAKGKYDKITLKTPKSSGHSVLSDAELRKMGIEPRNEGTPNNKPEYATKAEIENLNAKLNAILEKLGGQNG